MTNVTPAQWPCEQNVVESVASYLRHEGWTIESIADTEARSPGADIRAVRSGDLPNHHCIEFSGPGVGEKALQGGTRVLRPAHRILILPDDLQGPLLAIGAKLVLLHRSILI
jgi:hypothetical protein